MSNSLQTIRLFFDNGVGIALRGATQRGVPAQRGATEIDPRRWSAWMSIEQGSTSAMAMVSTYLNFNRNTLEAFNFYAAAFGTEITGIMKYSDVPVPDGHSGPSDEDKDLVINMSLPILGGHMIMGTDVVEGMGGPPLNQGNGTSICLHPDTREEADRLFAALSDGGSVSMPMDDMFWGDYYGAFRDKFGVEWMINHHAE
jgi:PhnB protein